MTAPEEFQYHHLDGEHLVLVCVRCGAVVPDAGTYGVETPLQTFHAMHNEWHATLAGWQNAVDEILDREAQPWDNILDRGAQP